jgi:hypothetical protein
MPTPNSTSPEVSPSGSGSFTQAKAQTSELGQKVADAVDENRATAAGKFGEFDATANALREKADSLRGSEKVATAANKATEVAGSAANYVRENGLKSMLADATQLAKNNPGLALLTVAGLGYLFSRAFSRH